MDILKALSMEFLPVLRGCPDGIIHGICACIYWIYPNGIIHGISACIYGHPDGNINGIYACIYGIS